MEHKKPWILRPVAWICTIIMMLLMQLAAKLICLLGEYILYRISGLSTIAIVILAMTFGGFFLSGYVYSMIFLSALLVEVSNKIYPSHHAFRYYFCGIWEIVVCAFLIIAALMGAVTGSSMFWFYARYGWLIMASISIMLGGRAEASKVPEKILHDVTTKTTDEAPAFVSPTSTLQGETTSYDRLLKVLQIGAGTKDVDIAIATFSSFYLKKQIEIPEELYQNISRLPKYEKCENLLRILELGIGIAGIDNVTRRLIDFYESKGVSFPDDIL